MTSSVLAVVLFSPSSTLAMTTFQTEASGAPKEKSEFQEIVAMEELMKETWGGFGLAGLPTLVLKVMAAEEVREAHSSWPCEMRLQPATSTL